MRMPPHAPENGAADAPTASAQQHRAEPGPSVSWSSTHQLPDASDMTITARADPTQTPLPVAISRETQPESPQPDTKKRALPVSVQTPLPNAPAAREIHAAPDGSIPAAPLPLRPTLDADAPRPSRLHARTSQTEPSPPADSSRDINISIGRIELRSDAARSPQPSQRAAFRPRVSLSDFLGRRDGGKR
jgi:hypothetical protein